MNHEVIERIHAEVVELDGKKKIPCYKALEIAKDFSIPSNEIGKILNEEGVKIYGCQLGCF